MEFVPLAGRAAPAFGSRKQALLPVIIHLGPDPFRSSRCHGDDSAGVLWMPCYFSGDLACPAGVSKGSQPQHIPQFLWQDWVI